MKLIPRAGERGPLVGLVGLGLLVGLVEVSSWRDAWTSRSTSGMASGLGVLRSRLR